MVRSRIYTARGGADEAASLRCDAPKGGGSGRGHPSRSWGPGYPPENVDKDL